MSNHLKTDWVRIGRSGDTIDGRTIEPEWLTEAAENYDKNYFSAPVWPGHQTWYRLGTVEDLKAEANDEGGVDLYAIISPNQYYRDANEQGQRLHTSMELRPNFQNKGVWYLKGLAATDEPASVATQEIKFSEENSKDSIFTDFTENKSKTFDEDTPPGWFQRFLSKTKFTEHTDEDAMSKETLEEIKTQLTAVTLQLAELKKQPAEDVPENDESFATKQELAALTQQVKSLADTLAAANQDESDDKFSELEQKVITLNETLDAALKQQDGTDGGEHFGDGQTSDDLI